LSVAPTCEDPLPIGRAGRRSLRTEGRRRHHTQLRRWPYGRYHFFPCYPPHVRPPSLLYPPISASPSSFADPSNHQSINNPSPSLSLFLNLDWPVCSLYRDGPAIPEEGTSSSSVTERRASSATWSSQLPVRRTYAHTILIGGREGSSARVRRGRGSPGEVNYRVTPTTRS